MIELQNLVGFILPPVIDLINFRVSNTQARFWIAFALCLAISVVLNFNKLTAGDIPSLLGSAGIVFSEAQIVYKTYWADSSLRTGLQSKVGGQTQ